jgi:hypothetical protein
MYRTWMHSIGNDTRAARIMFGEGSALNLLITASVRASR